MTWRHKKDIEAEEERKKIQELSGRKDPIVLNCEYLEITLASGNAPPRFSTPEYDTLRGHNMLPDQEVKHRARLKVSRSDYDDFVKQFNRLNYKGYTGEVVIKPRSPWSSPHEGPFYFQDIRLTRIEYDPVANAVFIDIVFNNYNIAKKEDYEIKSVEFVEETNFLDDIKLIEDIRYRRMVEGRDTRSIL